MSLGETERAVELVLQMDIRTDPFMAEGRSGSIVVMTMIESREMRVFS
jgi:hypothetical protein